MIELFTLWFAAFNTAPWWLLSCFGAAAIGAALRNELGAFVWGVGLAGTLIATIVAGFFGFMPLASLAITWGGYLAVGVLAAIGLGIIRVIRTRVVIPDITADMRDVYDGLLAGVTSKPDENGYVSIKLAQGIDMRNKPNLMYLVARSYASVIGSDDVHRKFGGQQMRGVFSHVMNIATYCEESPAIDITVSEDRETLTFNAQEMYQHPMFRKVFLKSLAEVTYTLYGNGALSFFLARDKDGNNLVPDYRATTAAANFTDTVAFWPVRLLGTILGDIIWDLMVAIGNRARRTFRAFMVAIMPSSYY